MYFLSLNLKIDPPSRTENLSCDDRDYKPKKETSDEELMQTLKKGKVHLNIMWEIWSDEYLLGVWERFKNQMKTTNKPSKLYPKVGKILHFQRKFTKRSMKIG